MKYPIKKSSLAKVTFLKENLDICGRNKYLAILAKEKDIKRVFDISNVNFSKYNYFT